jgi:hypothetical protein
LPLEPTELPSFVSSDDHSSLRQLYRGIAGMLLPMISVSDVDKTLDGPTVDNYMIFAKRLVQQHPFFVDWEKQQSYHHLQFANNLQNQIDPDLVTSYTVKSNIPKHMETRKQVPRERQ